MPSYIHFTEEQKQRAAAVDLEEFLCCRGLRRCLCPQCAAAAAVAESAPRGL